MHFCCTSIYQLCNYFIENFWSPTCQSYLILRQTGILGRVSFLVHCSLFVLASHVVVCLEKIMGWEVGLVDNQISPCTCPPSLKALPRAFELFWTAPPSPFSPSIASSACGSCPSASSLYCSPPDQTVVFTVVSSRHIFPRPHWEGCPWPWGAARISCQPQPRLPSRPPLSSHTLDLEKISRWGLASTSYL